MSIRHGIIIVGNAFCGKSSIINILSKGLTKLLSQQVIFHQLF